MADLFKEFSEDRESNYVNKKRWDTSSIEQKRLLAIKKLAKQLRKANKLQQEANELQREANALQREANELKREMIERLKRIEQMQQEQYGEGERHKSTGGNIPNDSNYDKNREKAGRFLGKLGDVFLKALPGLLMTVVSGVCSMIFGKNNKYSKGWKESYA